MSQPYREMVAALSAVLLYVYIRTPPLIALSIGMLLWVLWSVSPLQNASTFKNRERETE
jgi:hypothetical protein